MRFNGKELSLLLQHTTTFDKEGVLYMKERQDSIFKKSEVYIDRYFKLKGNLFFYFKNKENKIEPLGLLVLERCTVELDLEEEAMNSFMLVCEGEDNAFKFAATTEAERDAWIQALHMASYECLKMQLQSLREQLQALTGRDPVAIPDSSSSGLDLDLNTEPSTEEPVLEISLSCTDLPNDSQGNPPNSLVMIHNILPQQQQLWVHLNHTEIAEKSNNPMYLKTIGFGDNSGVDTSTRVRLTVYNVKERMTGTMAQLGQSVFTLQDVLMSPDMTLTLNLQSHDVKSSGKITVMAWINDSKVSLTDLQQSSSSKARDQPASVSRKTSALCLGPVRASLRFHFDNVIKKSFRFATNSDSKMLQVHELMAEFQHAFSIPIQLLRIWIDEEKQKNSLLQDLGELLPEWEAEQIAWITISARTAEHYTNSLDMLVAYRDTSFKRSVDKDKTELEFVPVNLHLQRMAVSSDASSGGKIYDSISMGAATAFNKKYKNGGLRRMLQQQVSFLTAENTSDSHSNLHHACLLRNRVTDLRTSINMLCRHLSQAVGDKSTQISQSIANNLAHQARELIKLCEDPVLCKAADGCLEVKKQTSCDGQDFAASLCNMQKSTSVSHNSKDKAWRWSGSSLVKSPITEPWEVTRLNLEAAVVCLISMGECVTETAAVDQEEQMREGIAKLQGIMEVVSAKISIYLTFLAMMENKHNIHKMHEVKYRRDIVNAHAITALTAGVCALVESADFLLGNLPQQLSHCGLLVEVEGLLSCYGEELGMIEDQAVAVDDLQFVTLEFKLADTEDAMEPTLKVGRYIKCGQFPDFNRHTLCLQIPISASRFSQLPSELQEGKQISVCPVFFNIGINEEATYAEKFGSTSVQDHVNVENMERLHAYYDKVIKLNHSSVENSGGSGSVKHLMKMLQANVLTKKSKNIEVLHLASEICRKLGGVRITTCKSGKDRTSMAVTLEMVQLLQRNHDLASHVFMKALDCVRSVGCRRENTYKNTGVRKYAFNRLQLLYIPKLYRAPGGTYGNIIT